MKIVSITESRGKYIETVVIFRAFGKMLKYKVHSLISMKENIDINYLIKQL